jgi:hypothetical protein
MSAESICWSMVGWPGASEAQLLSFPCKLGTTVAVDGLISPNVAILQAKTPIRRNLGLTDGSVPLDFGVSPFSRRDKGRQEPLL